MILIREFIDDSLFDYTGYARFYDLLEQRDGVWRIQEWNCIYDKDRLDPVVPSWDASTVYAQAQLEGPRERVCLHAAAASQARPSHPGVRS